MKNRAFLRQLVWVLALTIALGTMGCDSSDTSARNLAIESALNQELGFIEIPNGQGVRIAGDVLNILKKAELAGLITRSSRADGDGNYEVIGTPKLVGIAVDPKKVWTAEDSKNFLGGEAGSPTEYPVRVNSRQANITKVVTNETYKGPLASPGEKHRLVLGIFRNSPSSAAAAMGISLAPQESSLLRFRCVVKYSEFKKGWSVVALDVGSINPEQWFTSKVM